MKTRNFWLNTFFAWLVFIGIDFLFHAAILKLFWTEEIPAIKSLDELALLIPFGYLSFYLLTLLVGYTYAKIFPNPPEKKELWQFILVWSVLFSISNLAGLYSYVDIPLKQLVFFNLVYFIEIVAVIYFINLMYTSEKRRRVRWICVMLFFGLVILGVVLQNVLFSQAQ